MTNVIAQSAHVVFVMKIIPIGTRRGPPHTFHATGEFYLRSREPEIADRRSFSVVPLVSISTEKSTFSETRKNERKKERKEKKKKKKETVEQQSES